MHAFRHDHHMEPIIVALNLFLASSPLRILHVMALKGQAYSRRRDVHPVAFYQLCVSPAPNVYVAAILEGDVTFASPNERVCCLGNGGECTNTLRHWHSLGTHPSHHSTDKAVIDTPDVLCVYKSRRFQISAIRGKR